MKYSKAQTLKKLKGRLKSAIILDQFCFLVDEWQRDKKKIITKLKLLGWLSRHLIVRSSSADEDGNRFSLAGHFDSILGVLGEKEIFLAIEKIIEGFGDRNVEHEIFVQPFLKDVKLAGVAFTKDPSNGAPYIVINFDDKSGRTNSVTSGDSNNLRTFYCHRLYRKKFGDFRDKILALCFELEIITKSSTLDIEFAIDQKNKLYLFQVRPLVVSQQNRIDESEHYKILQSISTSLASWMKKHPYLCGDRAIYGVMPDWNPAEIIGIKPNPLAVSLYREVITNSIWAYQRDSYGYRNLRSFPLLVELDGMPYIDIRVSFNSFIPAGLNQKIAQKLVNFYLQKLIKNPQLHDKVEFEIVFSCFTFDISKRLLELKRQGFSSDEIFQIKKSLLDLTNKIISPKFGLWREDLKKIEILKSRHKTILDSSLDKYAKLYWLIEDCKRYGTLPFAGLARAGFIAVQILKSLVAINIINQTQYDLFMSSVNSISSKMLWDNAHLSKSEFLVKYGHLRPGTYDILSPRYDEAPDLYFDWSSRKRNDCNASQHTSFALTIEQLRKIQAFIDSDHLQITVLELLEFIKTAIEAREYSKFAFSRSVSEFLKILTQSAEQYNISKEDCAYVDLHSIMSLYSSSVDPVDTFCKSIAIGKNRYHLTQAITLPPLITSAREVWSFEQPETTPNFITQQCAI